MTRADRNGTLDDGDCHNLTNTFYEHLLWTSAAEFPGTAPPTYGAHLMPTTPSAQCSLIFTLLCVCVCVCVCVRCAGILLTLVIIELLGRKITMAVEFFGTALFFALILICTGM